MGPYSKQVSMIVFLSYNELKQLFKVKCMLADNELLNVSGIWKWAQIILNNLTMLPLLLVTCSNIQYAKYNFAFEGCILVTFYYYVTTIECYDIWILCYLLQ